MNITSAKFVKGIIGPDEILNNPKPHIAFIGRSNVGKSSLINALAKQKGLAKTSSFPGRTQQINFFLISTKGGPASGGNNSLYLVDLPGYGYAKGSKDMQTEVQKLIYWYFFESDINPKKVVLIVDANVGLTTTDSQMLMSLNRSNNNNNNIIIVANKTDKVNKTLLPKQLKGIQDAVGKYKVLPVSAEKKTGLNELVLEIFK